MVAVVPSHTRREVLTHLDPMVDVIQMFVPAGLRFGLEGASTPGEAGSRIQPRVTAEYRWLVENTPHRQARGRKKKNQQHFLMTLGH